VEADWLGDFTGWSLARHFQQRNSHLPGAFWNLQGIQAEQQGSARPAESTLVRILRRINVTSITSSTGRGPH
jgi:hypothetical protein